MKTFIPQHLSLRRGFSKTLSVVIQVLMCSVLLADADHDHDRVRTPGSHEKIPQRPDKARAQEGGCGVKPGQLADVANKDTSDYGAVVQYLTEPTCQPMSAAIAAQAFQSIRFREDSNFPLNRYATLWADGSDEKKSYVANTLESQLPSWWRVNPPPSGETASLIAQLSVLSPSAAKWGLGQWILGELRAENRFSAKQTNEWLDNLKRLGLGSSAMANEVSGAVEEMALAIQSESLASVFRGLARAASQDSQLVNAFNLAAESLNRGIQRAFRVYTKEELAKMTLATFQAVEATSQGNEWMDPGAFELNEAMGTMLGRKPLNRTELKAMWERTIKILLTTRTQTLLAEALGRSLQWSWVYLPENNRKELLGAAFQYPGLARRLQLRFIDAWERQWNQIQIGKISINRFNTEKRKYFEPVAKVFMSYPPESISPVWVKFALTKRLIQDELIEGRLPLLVLELNQRHERRLASSYDQVPFESWWGQRSADWEEQWALGDVYLPALFDWVLRQSKNEPPPETISAE